MGLYDWQSALKEALRKNKRDAHNRYLQLATVREDGSPANRTVVFRGFTENSSQLCMVTDLRSEKLAEIALQPMGEACWYFTNTREQFRLRGELTADGASDSVQRRATWGNLSDAAKAQFFWHSEVKRSLGPSVEVGFARICKVQLEPLPPLGS